MLKSCVEIMAADKQLASEIKFDIQKFEAEGKRPKPVECVNKIRFTGNYFNAFPV